MTIKIGSNIASLQAQRRLGEASSSLGKIYERLSSGQRINTSSDDAAGLAIAADLNSKSKIFAQALRNVNDGISVMAVADATVSALSDIAVRLKELSEQSASGTYSIKQRDAIDKEAQALSKEYFRISRSAQFNGQKLFDGSLADGLRLQVGIGTEGSILTHVGSKLGTGGVTLENIFNSESNQSLAAALGDLNGDGVLDLVTVGFADLGGSYANVSIGNGNGTFGQATTYATSSEGTVAVKLSDLNGDGILDMISAAQEGSNGVVQVRLGVGDGTFGAGTSFSSEAGGGSYALSVGDINSDGIMDIVTAGQSGPTGYATARLGIGNGTFGSGTSYLTETSGSRTMALGDLNGDGILDLITGGLNGSQGVATVRLGSGGGSFGSATSYIAETNGTNALSIGDLNSDGFLDLVTAGIDGSGAGVATIRLGTGNGTFGTSTSIATETGGSYGVALGDLNGDGTTDIVTTGASDVFDAYVTVSLGAGNGTFAQSTSVYVLPSSGFFSLIQAVQLGDLDGDGVTDIVGVGAQYDGAGNFDGKAAILLGQTRDGISPLQPFSLKTKSDALQSIGLFSHVLDNLSLLRGTIGANQSRLNVVNSNLVSTKENFIAASTRITDADVAQDAANLIRTQILQQAATAILAQANQSPALALKLLQ